ncbi:glycosyltransferase family 4 protein [Candidatus Uhrbacteria bacterium]|nr:glycosyltransferase family 4 protein [Candidatus Uhrbacteria bacterium]
MKIVMIGQKSIPAGAGGVERHVEDLSRRLVQQGHEVIAYCQRKDANTQRRMPQWYGIRLFYIPIIRTKHLATVTHVFLATMHALFLKPDVIHYHGIGPSLFAVIPRMCTPWVTVISTFHSQDYFHKKWGRFARAVFHMGEYVACHWTHKTIVVSRALEEYVSKTHGRSATYIPNAVPFHEKVKPNKMKERGIPTKNYILSVSRLVRHKGIHTIIEAYSLLKASLPNAPKLVIVGGSSFTDDYVRSLRAQAAGDKDILFTGELSGSILGELYSNASVFVQASEDEGVSLALLEALSYGCPILASDIVGNREVLSCPGCMFQNMRAPDLALKLQALLTREHFADACARERQAHVRNLYDVEKTSACVSRLYGEFLRPALS